MQYSLSEMWEQYCEMEGLAIKAHRDQMYGEKPYTYHLLQVLSTWQKLFPPTHLSWDDWSISEKDVLREAGAMVCLGHDLIEDTFVTEELLIEKGFHPKVVEAIVLLTRKEGIPHKQYIKELSGHKLAWQVKVADTHSNLTESIKTNEPKRVRKYSKQLELLYKMYS